jgi:propionyl-CoA carboxylase alpha chain
MFEKILIANRGEIAVRIIKTAQRLGVKTVVVYSEADADSLAVALADESVHIGPPPASETYLVAEKIIAAAKATGAQAIHPGFGFLSEKASFARQCAAAGLVFIGPNPNAIDAMGDKIESKKFASAAKVSTVPGFIGVIEGIPHAIKIAEEIGYPVMVKASAGGGGKGMRIAWTRKDVEEGFPAAQAEARNSFGDDRVFIEKFVTEPRHIEIQVLGDKHGNVIHLNERECSIQRRNQKVIEEAPSPFLDAQTRKAMGEQAVALSKAVNYDSAGTVEFIVDKDRNFYFLEMNTRLQVEHPVTELITGVDLVEQMLRSAYGEPLNLAQSDVTIHGWAMESRIYAEDPYRKFLPSIGRLVRYQPPKEGEHGAYIVRNDTGVREGDEISMFYDPMIAKLCTWGATRSHAVAGMARALEDFHIEGPGHNVPFLSAVMDQERFQSGKITTGYIAEEFPDGFKGLDPRPEQIDLMTAVAAYIQHLQAGRCLSAAAPRRDWVAVINGAARSIRLTSAPAALDIEFCDEGRNVALTSVEWRPGLPIFKGCMDGVCFSAAVTPAMEGVVVRHRAATAKVLILTPLSAMLHAKLPAKPPVDTSTQIVSPMPGLVVALDVVAGQEVRQGETVAVIEAMKMQNIIRAERDGVIKAVGAKAGDSIAADEVLIEFA